MSELYLTGVLMYAGDIPLHEGGQLRVLPGVVVDMKREDLAAAPSLPMYQQVAVVPVAEIAELRAEIASVTAELQSARNWILNDSKTIGELRDALARHRAKQEVQS